MTLFEILIPIVTGIALVIITAVISILVNDSIVITSERHREKNHNLDFLPNPIDAQNLLQTDVQTKAEIITITNQLKITKPDLNELKEVNSKVDRITATQSNISNDKIVISACSENAHITKKPLISPTKDVSIVTEYQYQNYAEFLACQNLQNQCQEQASLIDSLQKQLQELNSVAFIGETWLNKWHSHSPKTIDSSLTNSNLQQPNNLATVNIQLATSQELKKISAQQVEAIANLEQQIAQLRSLEVIGENRLSKWRFRSF